MENEKFRYYAFISYSYKDKEIAREIQKQLENYLPPVWQKFHSNPLGNFGPIFIDEASPITEGNVKKALQASLDSSNYLLVICSPSSAKSKYVNDEVDYFIKIGRREHIIPLVIDGEPHSENASAECLPPAILAMPKEYEPLAINIKEYGSDIILRVVVQILESDLKEKKL